MNTVLIYLLIVGEMNTLLSVLCFELKIKSNERDNEFNAILQTNNRYIDLIQRRIQLFENFVKSEDQRTANKIKLIISFLN
jgi:hypothetical protein